MRRNTIRTHYRTLLESKIMYVNPTSDFLKKHIIMLEVLNRMAMCIITGLLVCTKLLDRRALHRLID